MTQEEEYLDEKNYASALTQAETYINQIPKFTKKNNLEHTVKLMDILGNPCEKVKIIHVAGTNGKGSVCSYLNSLFLQAGCSVGMFTSPHLTDIRERIQIRGEIISRKEFVQAFDVVKNMTDRETGELKPLSHPTFFEFLFLIAMVAYEAAGIKILVLETGLGGRLDTTNIFKNPWITIITEIGLDHCQYLGDTIEQIAKEKAGIIKEGVPLVFADRRTAASDVIKKRAEKMNSQVYPVNSTLWKDIKFRNKGIDFSYKSRYYGYITFTLSTSAVYQVENVCAALRAYEILMGKEGTDSVLMQNAVRDTKWPARMEEIKPGVFLDGAHNEDGIDAFLDSVRKIPLDGKRILMFSAVSDKEYAGMIHHLVSSGLFSVFIVAGMKEQRAVKEEILARLFEQEKAGMLRYGFDTQEAFSQAVSLKEKADLVYIVGSLYLAGEVKNLLRRKKNDQL